MSWELRVINGNIDISIVVCLHIEIYSPSPIPYSPFPIPSNKFVAFTGNLPIFLSVYN